MKFISLPFLNIILWVGFLIQAVGGTMLAIDTRSHNGTSLLIIFTIIATIIFHRFWNVDDQLIRHLHISFIFSNIAIIGALVLFI